MEPEGPVKDEWEGQDAPEEPVKDEPQEPVKEEPEEPLQLCIQCGAPAPKGCGIVCLLCSEQLPWPHPKVMACGEPCMRDHQRHHHRNVEEMWQFIEIIEMKCIFCDFASSSTETLVQHLNDWHSEEIALAQEAPRQSPKTSHSRSPHGETVDVQSSQSSQGTSMVDQQEER